MVILDLGDFLNHHLCLIIDDMLINVNIIF